MSLLKWWHWTIFSAHSVSCAFIKFFTFLRKHFTTVNKWDTWERANWIRIFQLRTFCCHLRLEMRKSREKKWKKEQTKLEIFQLFSSRLSHRFRSPIVGSYRIVQHFYNSNSIYELTNHFIHSPECFRSSSFTYFLLLIFSDPFGKFACLLLGSSRVDWLRATESGLILYVHFNHFESDECRENLLKTIFKFYFSPFITNYYSLIELKRYKRAK